MTLGAIIKRVWEELGEPSDLNPATVGIPKLREAVNDSQDVIAQWIDDRGRKVFFREMDAQFGFNTVVETGTLNAQTSMKTITLPVTSLPSLGRYNRWVMRIGSDSRTVIWSAVSGASNLVTVSKAFPQDVSGMDYLLSKVDYQFEGLDAIDTEGMRTMEVLRVFDSEDENQLDKVAGRDYLFGASVGKPGGWRNRNTGILFDIAPEISRHYFVHVKKLPSTLNDQTDETDLPDAFVQALILRTVWWGYRRMQDFQAAYTTKKEFTELMTRLATASWMSEDPDYFTVRSR